MPTPFVKKLSRETGKSVEAIEKLWAKAKKITSEEKGVKEADFGSDEYAYCVGIVKKMVGVDEALLDPERFINSDKNAHDFIEETMVSSGFDIGNVVPPSVKPEYLQKDEKPLKSGSVGDEYGMPSPKPFPGVGKPEEVEEEVSDVRQGEMDAQTDADSADEADDAEDTAEGEAEDTTEEEPSGEEASDEEGSTEDETEEGESEEDTEEDVSTEEAEESDEEVETSNGKIARVLASGKVGETVETHNWAEDNSFD